MAPSQVAKAGVVRVPMLGNHNLVNACWMKTASLLRFNLVKARVRNSVNTKALATARVATTATARVVAVAAKATTSHLAMRAITMRHAMAVMTISSRAPTPTWARKVV